MGRKLKALFLILFLFVSAAAIGSCSASLEGQENPRMVTADDGGQEELLDEDDEYDPVGRPENRTATGKAGGILASVGYVAMTIGSAALPLLMLF
jgi:hypothetical protein